MKIRKNSYSKKSLLFPPDTLLPSEAESLADELCTLDPEDFSSLAMALGLPQPEEEEERGEGEERKRKVLSCSSQRNLLLGHLLVYDRSTPYHARCRLAHLLMGQGLLRQALRLDPSGKWCMGGRRRGGVSE